MSEATLFQEALAKPSGERAAFLDAVCADQPELRAAVEALLAAHETADSLLDQPPAGRGQTVDAESGPERPIATTDYHPPVEPGLVIAGRYTLVEEIGAGGMGEVWVAKQTEPVKRKVALKLIKTGMDSKAVLQRFEQERQALALMDHPHIARVLDGGLTPTGQPFFVMELVNGLPLTRFCDEARLTPRQRLELFVPICQAVQHAHQKGIIHRDLKPANILVTLIDGKPVPKVIDFGVAKATAGKLTDESLSTQFGAVIGTLEYMAPEQAGYAGEDIDTRADIYSLGVILYELLTGLRPLDAKRFKGAALTEMVRIIREEEPPKPSARLFTEASLPSLAALRQTEPKKLMALLRGELDWVAMKCLEKQRERRYETANGLAREIQRYLADEPVEARPPSARYRLGKFLRRNKGPVLAGSLVLLALIGGIVGTTLGMLQAERGRIEAEQAQKREAEQRDKAEKAREQARQALEAMASSVTGGSLATQKALSAEQKKFLSSVLSYYREFAGETAGDEQARARKAEVAGRVGAIEYRLGRKEEAAAAFRQARDGYAQLAADFPAVVQYRRELAVSHANLGYMLAELGQRAEAEQQFRHALTLRQKLADDFSAVPQYRQDLAASHETLGNVLAELGQRAKAEQQYRLAQVLLQKLADDFPAVPEYRDHLALSHTNLGSLLETLGQRAEAEQQYRRALALQQKLADDFPTVPQYRQDLATNHNSLGMLLAGLGQRAEAKQQFRRALALQQRLANDFPAVPEYQIDLGGSYCNFGHLLNNSGQPSESLSWYDKAIRTLTAVYEQDRRSVRAKQFLRNSYGDRARAYDHLQKYAEAVKDYDKAIELSPKQEQPGFRVSRATTRIDAGQVAEAVAEVAELTKTPHWDAYEWYGFAFVYAVASGKIAEKKQEYAERAMQLLHQAVKAGYNNAAHMSKDTDLDSLRGRDDFKKLMQELQKKPAAGKEKLP